MPRFSPRPARAFAGLAVLAALAGPGCGPPAFPVSASHPLLGAHLPEIHRQSLDGHTVDKGSLTGTPVLVKFFADYCQPCKETLPAVERIHEAYPDVMFVGVDEDESGETAKDVARRYGLSFPVIHDASNVLAGRFRVSTMPMTFVADPSGTIRWVGAEGQTEQELRQAVQAARAAPRAP
ncbi:MAG TPA: TlpA disulfide reductase family protein [Polyangiaceae bacterium]|jgi:thiol-disulfide isomerase/thioredoxin